MSVLSTSFSSIANARSMMLSLSLQSPRQDSLSRQTMERCRLPRRPVCTHAVANNVRQFFQNDSIEGFLRIRSIVPQDLGSNGFSILIRTHVVRLLKILHFGLRLVDDVVCCICLEEMLHDFFPKREYAVRRLVTQFFDSSKTAAYK